MRTYMACRPEDYGHFLRALSELQSFGRRKGTLPLIFALSYMYVNAINIHSPVCVVGSFCVAILLYLCFLPAK